MKYMNVKKQYAPLNLQFFAEGGEGDDGGDAGEGDDQDEGEGSDEDGEDEKKYSQKDVDETVKKRLARERRKWQREQQKEKTELNNAPFLAGYSTNIDGMSEKEYNHHGWAKVNDVLSQQELADFQQKVGEKAKNGQNWYMNLEDGRYMFAVGQDGVNSTLIISDGDFQHPSIEKVYRLDLDNETDIEIVREFIYDNEKSGLWLSESNVVEEIYGYEVIKSYSVENCASFYDLWQEYGETGTEGEGNTGGYGNLPNGRGSNQKTRIDFSLSDKVSSDDGIFFDGKNTDGWNVSGKDIALEDIRSVRLNNAPFLAGYSTKIVLL